jgi:co-chaperonin GroES (HSP10)
MKVQGKIVPLSNKVLISNMNFDGQKTFSGIIIPSDNGKVSGIHPRWGKVWAVGPDQSDVKVGEWILVEHGRWTRSIEHELDNGKKIELRMVDNSAILMSADNPPNDILLAFQNTEPAKDVPLPGN